VINPTPWRVSTLPGERGQRMVEALAKVAQPNAKGPLSCTNPRKEWPRGGPGKADHDRRGEDYQEGSGIQKLGLPDEFGGDEGKSEHHEGRKTGREAHEADKKSALAATANPGSDSGNPRGYAECIEKPIRL